MNRIKRTVSLGIMIIIAYLLQTVVFPCFLYLTPNVLLILVVFLGVMNDQYTGILTGFAAGLLLDCMFGRMPGGYALLYMLIGFVSGLCHRNFYGNSLLLPTGLLAVMDVSFGMIVYLCVSFMHHGFHIFRYLRSIILPEMIYTVFVGILLYKIIYWVNDRTL